MSSDLLLFFKLSSPVCPSSSSCKNRRRTPASTEMDKGKQRAESAQDFDVMDEAEIRQIIDRSGIIEDGSGGLGDGVRFVKPSELDQRQSTSGSRPSSSSNSSLRAAAVNGRNRPRKLVELIDGDETGEAIEYEEDEQGPEISEFGEEMFRMTLYMIVFGTLWLCMCVRSFQRARHTLASPKCLTAKQANIAAAGT